MAKIHPKFNEKLSVLINSQVPQFVQLDHPIFISFLEAYFEFLEQDGTLLEFISQSDKYMDIDKSIDKFNVWFKRKFLADIPENALSSKEFLVKHIREFYRARGTKNSYKFLFRIMFNEEIDFRFPREELLKSSDGKWIQDKFLKSLFVADTLNLSSREVTGGTSGATAILENMLQLVDGGKDILEIKTSHEKGNFTIGETVSGTDSSGNAKSFVVDGGIKNTSITNSGSGYAVGNILNITGGGPSATNMEVKVKSIKGGTIDNIAITTAGTGYTKGNFLIFNNTGHLAIDGSSSIIKIEEVEGMVSSLTLSNPGDGYLTIPNLTFSGGVGTGASAKALLDSPGIITINIDSGGAGYTSIPNIRIEGGGGSGATAIATILGGVVNTITIANRGTGYTSNPVIILEGGGFTALATASVSLRGSKIASIELLTEGQGYTSSPTITIDAPQAGGTTAIATSSIIGTNGDGRITKLNIVNKGKNYISLPTISPSVNGSGATFTPSSNTIGGINELEITKHGIGVTSNPLLDLTGIGDGTATGIASAGASLIRGSGRWLGTDSQLSSNRVLEDNDFFQIYSYVIKHSGQTVNFWSQVVKQVLHPAGTKLFGEISLLQTIQMPFGASAFADKEITLFFPLINFLQVPIATVAITSVNSDIQIRIISAEQITGLGVTNKIFDILSFFDQGGYSQPITNGLQDSLNNIWITNGGTGYVSPVVTISAPSGGGTTAIAIASQNGGVINSIFLTNPGSGYAITDFPLTINITGGTGATAKASLASNGGSYSIKYLNDIFNQNILNDIEEFPQQKIKITNESFIEKYK